MIKNKYNFLSSADAAELLGLSKERIIELINQGRIKAEKFGRSWIIEKKQLKGIKRQRFPRDKE